MFYRFTNDNKINIHINIYFASMYCLEDVLSILTNTRHAQNLVELM